MSKIMVSASITRVMRGLTVFAGLAVLAAFVLLFFYSENTREMFAWTVNPPAAAAFLGAGYGAIVVSSVCSLLARTWADIRIPVAVLVIGLVFILATTLLHLDRFHFARAEFVPRNVAIGWVVLYGSIPPLLVLGIIGQFRAGTAVQLDRRPLPVWARVVYVGIALITGLAGLGLFFAPATTAPLWFWPLTPLLARMAASWLLGVSSAAVLIVLDNHLGRIRIAALTLIAYAVLQFIVLARYAADVNWAMPMAWMWIAVLVIMVVINSWAVFKSNSLQSLNL